MDDFAPSFYLRFTISYNKRVIHQIHAQQSKENHIHTNLSTLFSATTHSVILLNKLSRFSNIFIVENPSLSGGLLGASTLKECATLENIVKKQAVEGRLYAAICASPAVAFGSWGLLKGLKATCYPSFMEQLSSTATAVESRVQQDGNAITSRGPGTTMEFSVALVEQLFGDKEDSVKGPLVMRSNPGDEYTIAEINTVEWASNDTRKVLVPIANGSEEMETISIIDVLRRAKAEVIVASVEDTIENVFTQSKNSSRHAP